MRVWRAGHYQQRQRGINPYGLLVKMIIRHPTFTRGMVSRKSRSKSFQRKHWAELSGPIFQPLRDPDFLHQVTLPDESETIEWPNGADLAAEYLYDIGDLIRPQENAFSASGRV